MEYRRFPADADPADAGIAYATAITTIVRIAGGNFRLVDRLLTRIERMQTANDLTQCSCPIFDTSRQALLIGH